MDNIDEEFVNELFDELVDLYEKDKNVNKKLLGSEPVMKIIENYSDWLIYNMSESPKVVANELYRDVKNIRYTNFGAKGLKKGVAPKSHKNFNLIYGNEKQIDDVYKKMNQLKETDPNKYELTTNVLQKIKELSDFIKPEKNIFGKTTNIAKKNVDSFKQPNHNTFMGLIKYDSKQLNTYLQQINSIIEKKKNG